MRTPTLPAEEIARRGEAIYAERIRPLVEPNHHGEYVVIAIDTGEYELDSDYYAALWRARDAFPDSLLHSVRIGHDAIHFIGFSPR